MVSTSKYVIGVDEVGMGCLAGPVVVCAVSVSQKYQIGDFGVMDSKKLSAKQRETIARLIVGKGISYRISYCFPKTIDRINIYQASRKAMRKAVKALRLYSSKALVLVDGPHGIPNLKLPQQAIVKGDAKVFAIAAASILAKVYRDRMMKNYAKRFPQYGFEKHKGYGTKLHYAMLSQHGPCDLHRKSFTLT